jgi:hypothetical protein
MPNGNFQLQNVANICTYPTGKQNAGFQLQNAANSMQKGKFQYKMLQIARNIYGSSSKMLCIACKMKGSSSKMLQMAYKIEGSSPQIAWKIGTARNPKNNP